MKRKITYFNHRETEWSYGLYKERLTTNEVISFIGTNANEPTITPCQKPKVMPGKAYTLECPSCSKLISVYNWDKWLAMYVRLSINPFLCQMIEAIKGGNDAL
jgi:hypothetical protein